VLADVQGSCFSLAQIKSVPLTISESFVYENLQV